ncbi:DUF6273 domain-containing protein [Thermoclostridium stercorarium]|uniref:glycan biosynthesis hexose transferase WsfD n=1 Tax=Thermoclostridium stercorarium TaxID=1510 RepID=UPI002248FB49|nr:DUF6273 domain-containing protein [Thermoclostridium stercorarium]UZQ86528.1 DUF6273 domain-containing protein [Thermoclostridium stercorarium]
MINLSPRHRYIILAVILFFAGVILLYVPNVVGIADNTDFIRISRPSGFLLDNNLKFFYFQRRFEYIKSFDNLYDFAGFVLNPETKDEIGLKSTMFLFVKAAQLADGTVSYLRYGKIEHFDIAALSTVFLLLHAVSVTLIYKALKTGKTAYDLFILLFLLTVFYNMGYILYYNSLFGESATLAGFLMWFSVLLNMVHNNEVKYPALILYFTSGIIFAGAKVANIPLGFLIAVFSIYFLFIAKTPGKRIFVLLGICLTVSASASFYREIPEWMAKPNNYHSIFYGILKGSDTPEEELQKLGIDTKYAVLANTTVYDDLDGFDVFGEEFQKEVHDKVGPLEVSLYYLRNPGRMFEKLKLSAESSVFIRPPYLGNYSIEDDTEIVKFVKRNSIWEWIRKQFNGYAFGAVTSVFLLYFSVTLYQFYLLKKKKGNRSAGFILMKFTLMIFAGSQWIFPVIGNGEADLIKHMFLFNLLLDTMIVLLVGDILKLMTENMLNRQIVLSFLAFFVVFFVLISADGRISGNKVLLFGRYKGQPLEWEVLEETDGYYFVVAKNIVEFRPFSGNTNYWPESNIKAWLNDDSEKGFLYEFSENEKNRILPMKRRTVIPPAFADRKEYGSRPLYWFCIPGYASQNYDSAYQVENTEKVFLLSIKEWENHDFKKIKGVPYWLRTPYTIGTTVRIVGEDGYVYHKKADTENIGVLPAMIIKKQ